MQQSRLPKTENPRIIVECLETKKKIIEIAKRKNETIKEVVVRLVDREFNNG